MTISEETLNKIVIKLKQDILDGLKKEKPSTVIEVGKKYKDKFNNVIFVFGYDSLAKRFMAVKVNQKEYSIYRYTSDGCASQVSKNRNNVADLLEEIK